jgi:hypothetical protein
MLHTPCFEGAPLVFLVGRKLPIYLNIQIWIIKTNKYLNIWVFHQSLERVNDHLVNSKHQNFTSFKMSAVNIFNNHQ